MGWPYEFVTLSDEEKDLRDDSIALHAAVGFCSAFAPAAALLLVRAVARVRRASRGQYREVPNSPAIKARRQSWSGGAAQRWRRALWWMGEDVYFLGAHWGHRDEWIMGLVWTVWLLFLCVRGTGKGQSIPISTHLESILWSSN